MMSPSLITALLNKKAAPDAEEMRQIEQLAIRFPYFVPARLLLASQQPRPAPVLQRLFLNRVMASGHFPPIKVKQPLPAEKETKMESPEQMPAAHPAVNPAGEGGIQANEAQADIRTASHERENHIDDVLDAAAAALAQPAAEPELPQAPPVFTEDYFRYTGIEVQAALPNENELLGAGPDEAGTGETEKEKALMVMMSFTDWLLHYRQQSQAAKEEEADRQRVKSAWQREKLAAALQEEDDEIPEQVFEMAVNSLNQEAGLVSESLAAILARQGKTEKAIEMYQKLSLKYPQKSAYFASQIENLKREQNL